MKIEDIIRIIGKSKPKNLTEEAKIYINYNFNNYIFLNGHCKNWIIAYDKEKKFFKSLSIEKGCTSTTFGDLNYLKKNLDLWKK